MKKQNFLMTLMLIIVYTLTSMSSLNPIKIIVADDLIPHELEYREDTKEISELNENVIDMTYSSSSDITPPVIDLTSLQISQKTAYPGDIVKVSVRAIDNESGVSHVYFNLRHESGAQLYRDIYEADENGYYNFLVEIEENTQSGKWKLDVIQARDNVGNSIEFWSGQYDLSAGNLEIINPNADNTAPVIDLTSLQISQKTAYPGDIVKVSVRAIDNESGVSQVYFNLRHENGAQLYRDIYEADENGYYNFLVEIEENTQSGKWKLDVIQARDNVGNSIEFWSGQYDLSAGNFEIINPNADNTAPVIDLTSLQISQKTAYPGDIVKVSVRAIDNESGVSQVYFNLRHENGAQLYRDIYEADENGYYNFLVEIEGNTQSGKWKLDVIQARDNVGNSIELWSGQYDLTNGNFEVSDANVYNVTFFTGGGTQVSSVRQIENTLLIKPGDPYLKGYLFGGWYLEDTHETLWNFSAMKVNSDFTLYAKWIRADLFDVVAGDNRFSTAAEISRITYENADTVVLTSGVNYPDALAGGPLAYLLNAPVLLTQQNRLSKSASEEMTRLGAKKVIILGSDAAVSASIADTIVAMGIEVERIEGSSRYTTAIEVAKRIQTISGRGRKAVIASGMDFADALSAGSYASVEGIPILLTRSDRLVNSVKEAIVDMGLTEIVLVGGYNAVKSEVEEEIESLGVTVTRIYGANRNLTSTMIAGEYFKFATEAIIANGMTFPDALASVPMAAKMEAPIILAGNGRISSSVLSYIESSDIQHVYFVGGDTVIPLNVRVNVASAME